MGASVILKRYLPRSFVGLVPLQCGVELIMLYTAINRMCGVFGLLSLFTNHPINFVQWLYYSTNVAVLAVTIICYSKVRNIAIQALSNNSLNTDTNLITIKILAVFVLIYMFEFITGNFFMAYLANLWFVEEYNGKPATKPSPKSTKGTSKTTQHLVKRVSEVLSLQSASESYEVFVSLFTIVLAEIVRLYFMAILLSYYLRLRKRISRQPSGWAAFAVGLLDKIN